jgi:uroporphyrinogen-III decarboxylase
MTEMSVTQKLDGGKSPQQLLGERAKRMQDAVELRQPDRIPIQLGFSYMLAEIGGITRQEFHDNPEKAQQILEQAALEFQPDAAMGFYGDPAMSKILGDRMTKWPGYGLGPDGSFQFNEAGFMKAEDYDAFLEDPADWAIRVYMPRAFSELSGFAMLPPLGMAAFGYFNLLNLGALMAPPVQQSLQAFGKAVQAAAGYAGSLGQSVQRLLALGFPPSPIIGGLVEAPFDFMSDTLRGMRGIMLDVRKRPEKLLAAQEKVARFELEYAISFARATGMTNVFFPLHRGSDGFLSLPQFEQLYWPQLKGMWLKLIDEGLTPVAFYEGVWDQRLKYLAELPKGKTVGYFQASDIFKVKEVVGDTLCIMGGMPNSLLQTGTVEDVREHTRKVCEVVGKGGGFIMSTGIGEMEGCKPDLVKAWVEATREYGVY